MIKVAKIVPKSGFCMVLVGCTAALPDLIKSHGKGKARRVVAQKEYINKWTET